MTLEEAIKHEEEVMDEMSYEFQECVATHDMEGAMNCRKYAEEHKQLAEWLKDYKRLLEQENILEKIRDEIVDTLYVDSLIFGELIDFLNRKISADDVIEEFNRVTRIEVLRIIDKYKADKEESEVSE